MSWVLFSQFVASIAGTIVVALVALLISPLRDALARLFVGLVQNRLDSQLEALRSELRRSEEKFRSDLQSAELHVSAMIDSAVNSRAVRLGELSARRLQAVEKLWASKCGLDRLKIIASNLSILKLDKINDEIEHDPQMRSYFEIISKTAQIDNDELMKINRTADIERPFLNEEVWAYFAAFRLVLLLAHTQAKLLSIGQNSKEILRVSAAKEALVKALPEYKSLIDEYGSAAYYQLLEPLEQKLLDAMRSLLEGRELDEETVRRSAAIVRLAKEAGQAMSPKPAPPSA